MSVQDIRKEISAAKSKIARLEAKIADRKDKLEKFKDIKLSSGDICDKADVKLWELEIVDANLQISMLKDLMNHLTSKLKDAMIERDLNKRAKSKRQPKTDSPSEMGDN